MPTSLLRAAMAGSPMKPGNPPSWHPDQPLISWLSDQAPGMDIVALGGANMSIAAHPAASRVIAFPVTFVDPYLVQKVWWANGAAGTDSVDVGLYTEDGVTRLVSGGSTLTSGSNLLQEADCTDTLIAVGRYWCAFVCGGVTATFISVAAGTLCLRAAGCAQMAGSGSTLGTTFTPAALAAGTIALFGFAGRVQAA